MHAHRVLDTDGTATLLTYMYMCGTRLHGRQVGVFSVIVNGSLNTREIPSDFLEGAIFGDLFGRPIWEWANDYGVFVLYHHS